MRLQLPEEQRADILKRLWSRTKVDSASGCWVWRGCTTNAGYGLISIRGSMQIVSRVSLVLVAAKGTEADRWLACHRCDNPPCWNPDHLWAGTHLENTDDMFRKGRARLPGPRSGTPDPRIAFAMCQLYYGKAWTLARIAREYGVTAAVVDGAIRRTNRADLEAVASEARAERRCIAIRLSNST